MNNGKFDLKRKLAFVAALAFVANSAYSVPRISAGAASAVMSVRPNAGAPDFGDPPPPPDRNSNEENEGSTYSITVNGIDLDDAMFMDIVRKIFNTDDVSHTFDADTGSGSVTVNVRHTVNRNDIFSDDGNEKFVLTSGEDSDMIYDTYYRVEGGSDDKITVKCREGDETHELSDGFCKSGEYIDIEPSDCYVIDGGTAPLSIAVDDVVRIRKESSSDDGCELFINEARHSVSARKFSLRLAYGVFNVMFDGQSTTDREFRWKDIDRLSIEAKGKQALYISGGDSGRYIDISDEKFSCSRLIEQSEFRYVSGAEFLIRGVDKAVNAYSSFGAGNDELSKNYRVSVEKKEDDTGYCMKVPYLAGERYCLSGYTYANNTVSGFSGVYDAITDGDGILEIPYSLDKSNITLVYKKLADSDNRYVFEPDGGMYERNQNCYTIRTTDAQQELMDFTSLFDGSTLFYDVLRRGNDTELSHRKFAVGESSRELTETVTDSEESALYIIRNIISKDSEGSVRDGLESVICFYIDKTAPVVELEGGGSGEWAGREGMSFSMNITDLEESPVEESGDLTFDEGEIADIYKNYINKETQYSSEIASVVVGDYRFDRPENGWGDTSKIKGYVETPDMRQKYAKAVSVLSGIDLSEINSRYSGQLNYDGYYRQLLREGSEVLMEDFNKYYNAKITAEEEKEEPDTEKIKALKAERDGYVKVIKAYSDAQSTPVRTSNCAPVLTYDKDSGKFSVTVKAEQGYADRIIVEDLAVFAFDDSNNSSWDPSDRKYVKVRIDGAPPVAEGDRISIENDEVITGADNAEIHVLRAGSLISAVIRDMEASADGSGVGSVKIYFGDDSSEAADMTWQDGKYVFNVGSDVTSGRNIKSFVSIYADDNMGNSAVIKSSDSKYGGYYVMIDDTAPVCELKDASDSSRRCSSERDGGRSWYRDYSDVRIAVYAEDPNPEVCSGIKELKLDINGEKRSVRVDAQSGISSDGLKNGRYQLAAGACADAERFTLKLIDTADNRTVFECGEFTRDDGAVRIRLTAADYAENESSESYAEVWIDLAVPRIDSVKAGEVDLVKDDRFGYVYFVQDRAEIRVTADRNGPSAGIDHIIAVLVGSDGTQSTVVPIISRDGDQDIWSIDVPESFKGYMKLKAVSCVGRESQETETDMFLVEKSSDHMANANIRLELPETSYKDIEGVPLYSDDINARISVNENFSGIAHVHISESGAADRDVFVNENGQLYGNESELWSIDGNSRDYNIVNAISRDINLSGNSNNDSIYISFEDNANNQGDSKAVSRSYSIDKTDPVMNVAFTDANGSADNEFKQIFKSARRAVITINERNFSEDLANIRVNGVRQNLSWKLISGDEGTDSATYQAEIPFDKDGTYRLTGSFRDLSGRAAKDIDSGEFVIDRTAPAMNIGFDKSIANEHYYNEPTTATFRISDQNFDPSRVVMTGTYNDSAEDFPKASEWTRSGNEYVSTVKFEKDGEYKVNITGRDKAGNTLEAYNAEFCIDSQSPKISVSDVSAANNKREIRPHIQFKDINLDKESIDIRLEGANRGKTLEFEGELRESSDGYEYVFNNIPDKSDYDDIYTIKASARDNASNEVETDFRFSVNRYGSTFMLDEGTGSLVGRYISRAQDVVISEVNANKHSEPCSVYITKDSEMNVLKENVDFKVELAGGDEKWAEYKYIIYAKNFADDGRYTVSIHSVDEAGNINVSTSEKKNSYLEFCVDTTDPLCIPLNVSENSAYKGERLDARMSVSDNIMLKKAKVFLDDKEIRSRYINDEYLEFTVPNAKHSQDIKVVLTDMAGNEIEYNYKNVLVTTNAIRLLAHRTWFKFVCGGVVLLSGAAAFFIRRRRKRLL